MFTDQQVQHQVDQSEKRGVVHGQADRLGLACGRDRISPISVELVWLVIRKAGKDTEKEQFIVRGGAGVEAVFDRHI